MPMLRSISPRQVLTSAFFLTIALPLAAVAQKRALQIEDYYRVRTVAAPRLSPSGGWVAYTVTTRIEETNGTATESWIARADGASPPRRIQHDGKDVMVPTWKGEGQLRYRTGDGNWVVDVTRPDATPAREERVDAGGLASPDRKWVASTRPTSVVTKPRAYASEFERRHEERFRGKQFDWLNYKRDGQAAPVPDPRDPVVNPSSEIFITPAGGGEARQITRLGLQPNGLEWMPDGSAIVFTADPDFRDESTYGGSDLWLATPDGNVRQVTKDDYVYGNPAFSPDGKLLAYTRGFGTDMVIKQKLDHGGPRDLFVMPATGGDARNLTADWDLEPGTPIWTPDNRHILFTASIGGESHLFRIPAAGGKVEQLTRGPRRIGGLSIDSTFRRIAYTVAVHDRPSDIYVANIDGTGERRLTDMHTDFLREVELSRTDRVEFRSGDGTTIEGWITLPRGYRPDGGPYPLIVSNHGGPHSADGYSFDFKNQLFAANGYAVLQVNFRSSTGYGEKFKWGTWGAWGTKDGQDVIAGVDHVISKYALDRSRVGTTGHSYGGFMTNWLITQYPDRFAAAVSGAGISNWISDYGLADIARTKETEFYGKPWEPAARDNMIRQSPLFYADRVKAPTLFIHGEVDYRVPFVEAEQFYFALRKNGIPSKIIQYAGQSHGISGHWNNVHRMQNELRWWETYLKKTTS